MKHIGMIYENDIPDDYLDYSDDFIHRQVHDSEEWVGHRFKPNGITDNREEWRAKNDLQCTDLAYPKVEILRMLDNGEAVINER